MFTRLPTLAQTSTNWQCANNSKNRLALDNITTPSGCSLAGSTYTCNLAAIGVGANRTVNLVGQLSVASGSTVTPQGSVVASGGHFRSCGYK